MKSSGFEQRVKAQLDSSGVKYKYQGTPLTYKIPNLHYTPDFDLGNGILIEAKGRFTREDRRKHLCLQQQHPEYEVRFVFQRAINPINKGSDTTYGEWCDKHGFKWSNQEIPKGWLK